MIDQYSISSFSLLGLISIGLMLPTNGFLLQAGTSSSLLSQPRSIDGHEAEQVQERAISVHEAEQVQERAIRYATDPAYRHQRDRELRRALPSTIPLLLGQSAATYLRGLNLLRKAGEDITSVTVVELQENLEEAAEGHVRLEARLNRMMEELQLGGVPTDETEQERLLEQIEHMGNLMDNLRDLEVGLDRQLQRAIQQQGEEQRDLLVESTDSNAAQLEEYSQDDFR